MKITRQQLKQIIKEELNAMVKETVSAEGTTAANVAAKINSMGLTDDAAIDAAIAKARSGLALHKDAWEAFEAAVWAKLDDKDETHTEPRDLWMHKYSNLIIGAMQQIGIPPDVIRPSEILKLAIGLIGGPEDAENESVFRGDIELAKKVAKAGGQQQSAHGYEKSPEWS